MNYIKGNIRNMIFESNTGYKVGLFKVKETNDDEVIDFINKTITFTGYFADINNDDTYILKGRLVYNDKYGYQYQVNSYERVEPKGIDAVISFLSSNLIKGCGEKTANLIVETLGEDAINKIKENYQNLLLVPGISELKAQKIYNSIIKYQSTDTLIVSLKEYGFTIQEALSIINKCGDNALIVVKENIYELIDIIDFNKLDKVFIDNNFDDVNTRIKACIIETLKRLTFNSGDTYSYKDEIYISLKNDFKIYLELDEYDSYLKELMDEKSIIYENNKYYLFNFYEDELDIVEHLEQINFLSKTKIPNFEELITELEVNINVNYNIDQKKAIKAALENRITIITGGPGTGKTTIINAIVKLYIKMNKLSALDLLNDIALLAPTGRASKKMCESTGLPASTIHRYLKWNKESNDFQVNEFNPNKHKLIILDETSMIDTHLFASLLKGLNTNIKLIIVGDENQLPSVGPGLILNDLIESNVFNHCPLERIYRQSDNSYIPILAREIKSVSLSASFIEQKDDYNFLIASGLMIKEMIRKICEMSKTKGLTEEDIQVLVPMYKGENGIDNLNILLQDLFNKKDINKKEIKIGDVIYREHDKVLQLVNNPDNNVYNGDIGYIKTIKNIGKRDIITIDFDGTYVEYNRDDMYMIRHAYAISIHKSQGSEFSHVIIPVSKAYYKMLYNKLIYTGVSRAKKSLVIIGEPEAFVMATNNNYSSNRKTSLKTRLMHNL